MMFASMTTIKTKRDMSNTELAMKQAQIQREEEEKARLLKEEERKRRNMYVPTEPVPIFTMHRKLEDDADGANNTNNYQRKISKIIPQHNTSIDPPCHRSLTLRPPRLRHISPSL